MFDLVTRSVLGHYTTNPPSSEDHWYGPWNAILTVLFPTAQGYIVTPQRRIPDESDHIPDFVVEVVKIVSPPMQLRTVLIVKIKNSQHWEAGIPALERQILRQTDASFSGTAVSQVYWIGVIGPHWRYGIKEDDGQDAVPLIDWHHVTHDQDSYNNLQNLATLVAAL
ncbi:hypothetical protein Agabi119p4_1266 [Agaricus bisporus var. burnettii]|uniref:Uncharacterized protein n=1 Tax=Agaricus bisporus var. burnettii TaxID=192524 RepID=A0A8H7FCI8_AGABI|nr:hypothetical protein Agabi119p4_1266 [Agaricus bisporus var. burnettii]